MLELRQKQLTELMEIERWAEEQNLRIAEFNTELARWEAEYAWQLSQFGIETELSLAQLSGTMPDGSPTLAARQAERSRLAEAAKVLLELGLTLTDEQLEALGWTEGQYEAYIQQQAAAAAAGQGGEAREYGPGVPEQPPITFAHMTQKRLVSTARPGPTMPSHQPLGFVSPGRMPATCESPVSAWQM